MILLLLSIQAAECNIWCISEGYDRGSYVKQCECIDEYPYSLIKIKKRNVKQSSQSKPDEVYEPFEDSPYLKIK